MSLEYSAKTRRIGSVPVPVPRVDYLLQKWSEHFSAAKIAHHIAYENKRTFNKVHVSQRGKMSHLVGPASPFAGKCPFMPSLLVII